MSDTLAFDPRYTLPAMVVNAEVADFKLDDFPRADEAEPLPDHSLDMTPLVRPSADPPPDYFMDMTPLVQPSTEPLPDPFEEFQVERPDISELLLPSLDGLFRPFDLASEGPVSEFDDLADFTKPLRFDYEDMDTRDQNVVRTLAQAEARSRELVHKARVEGFAISEAARTEAQGLVAEARARAGVEAEVYAESLRREAEVVTSEAESRRGEIESLVESLKDAAEKDRAAAEALRLEAEAEAEALRREAEALRREAEAIRREAEDSRREAEDSRREAEDSLAAVKDRIAGLDMERRKTEEELEGRRRELEAEYQGLKAELAARREEVLAEARAAGRREGYDQGLVEGRPVGRAEGLVPWREKTALLAGLLERLENLYQDLWRANGPMMIQLAIEAVEGILNKELRSAEDLAVRAFEACIDFLGQAHRVVFQARPQDLPLLEEARADQRQRLGALVKVTFQPDESLGPGDLIMESDVGRLDATVKHRAAQVIKVLREAFESAQAAEPPAGPRPAEGSGLPEGEKFVDLAGEGGGASSPVRGSGENFVGLVGAGEGGDASSPVQGSPAGEKFVDLAEEAEAVEAVSALQGGPEDA